MCTVTDNGSSSSSSSTTSGPQISNRSFKRYGYGIDVNFRITNESCSYEWYIYDKVPSNNTKTELDSGSGSTYDKNEDIFISTNNLQKNTQYYFVFKVYGDNTRRTNYYADNGTTSSNSNSYYIFRTMNSDTWATGNNSTGGTSTTKKNSDGTTTKKTTSTKDGIRTETEETTGYTDGRTETKSKSTPTTSTATWKSSEVTATLYSDGSATQTMITTMKDGTIERKEAKTSSLGTTNVVTGTYSKEGALTALSSEIDNSEHAAILNISYKLGSGENVSVKKMTASKSSITIPDSLTIKDTEYTVTAVEANAFKGNTKVKKLVLGDSIKKVGANAFKGNKNLKTVLIKNPLSSVGTNAFKGIYKYATIKIDAGASAYNKTVKKIQKAGVGNRVKFKNI